MATAGKEVRKNSTSHIIHVFLPYLNQNNPFNKVGQGVWQVKRNMAISILLLHMGDSGVSYQDFGSSR